MLTSKWPIVIKIHLWSSNETFKNNTENETDKKQYDQTILSSYIWNLEDKKRQTTKIRKSVTSEFPKREPYYLR